MIPWLRHQWAVCRFWARRLRTALVTETRNAYQFSRGAVRAAVRAPLAVPWHAYMMARGLLRWAGRAPASVRTQAAEARQSIAALPVLAFGLGRLPASVWSHMVLRRLVLALPAFAAVAATATWVGLYHISDHSDIELRYRTEGEQLLAERQWEAARLRFRRLAGEGRYEHEAVFGLARSLEGMGQAELAEDLLIKLAPDDAAGLPAAHVLRARKLLADMLEDRPFDVAAAVRAENHLVRALQTRPDDPEAHALLGQYYFKIQAYQQAQVHLTKAADSHPELNLLLARLCARDDPAEATRLANRAVRAHEERLKQEPNNVRERLRLADALLLLNRFPQAMVVLREGLAVNANEPRLLWAMVTIYAIRYDSLKGQSDSTERLRILQEGLTFIPASGLLIEKLVEVAQDGSPDAQAARPLVEQFLNNPKSAPSLHIALAGTAHKRGDLVKARHHLEEALKLRPESVLAANNLAWILATQPQPDLPRALDVINGALKHAPEDANCRDTRGQIYVKLKRWQEAIDDLSFAVGRIAPNRDTYRALAEAYRAVGNTTLAQGYQEKADRLSDPPK